ncbi:hypothetical protein Csa_017758 [Cucumis sativus]|nr:hypothetical protein Csa_017758 [Cucumis sativus]
MVVPRKNLRSISEVTLERMSSVWGSFSILPTSGNTGATEAEKSVPIVKKYVENVPPQKAPFDKKFLPTMNLKRVSDLKLSLQMKLGSHLQTLVLWMKSKSPYKN